MSRQEFIEWIAPAAQKVQAKYGVPASIVIAQAALESGWGSSAKGNNFFGIKAGKNWHGDVQTFITHEFINGKREAMPDKFRRYSSAWASLEDHGKLLANHERYSAVIGAMNAHQAADALQRAGYATDPKYASLLKSIIDTNDLTRFDDARYKNYAKEGARFEETRKQLNAQRQADPDSWSEFMQGFVSMLATLVEGITSFFTGASKTQDVASVDHTNIEVPTVPNKQRSNTPTQTTARS